ncbi:MAG: ATP-dependent Clp protease ATP-binding subunit ClpA [Nitrospirae bacterium]|nr:ATP-dependent Clp protease ATP-binding subunit ClpA [Nitrospirota bacterium]
MLNREIESSIQRIINRARQKGHEYVTVEHLLYAILEDEWGSEILYHCGADLDYLKESLNEYFDKYIPTKALRTNEQPQPTIAFQRVLSRAIDHVRAAEKQEADAGDLLAAMFYEEDSYAVELLQSEGISRLDVLEFISHGVSKRDEDFEDDYDEEEEPHPSHRRNRKKADPLELYTTELVDKARRGEIDPLVGRQNELKRTIQILARRRKNNVVFVGEAGVGKTALVEGLALKIAKGEVPEILKNAKIYAIDLGGMIAGTKYRGEFEARLKATIKRLEEIEGAIMFIDEIHTVVGAGATSGGSLDASNILKPFLVSGKLRCIGASTYEEYKKYFEKDKALSRRFQKVELQEPSVEETVKILKGLKNYYEEFHGVRYTEGALRAAAELSAKYINDKFLPDKAIDVIDEAGAEVKLHSVKKTVGVRDIENIVSRIARIPARSVSTSDTERLQRLEEDLKSVVFGQDEAIHNLVSSIKRARAGLGHPDKPIGSFLFTGPTGVGKTEVARQLANTLGVKFIRFDMSEYMEKHSVARLIGAPPGYVGFDQGGLLTDAIRRNPYAVLLLDEIEKAHPDVFNILLQVMDYASLTDNNGKKADFRNVILIMTSNAGAREMQQSPIGFGNRTQDALSKSQEAINRLFSPEFRNRLDAIITFKPLTHDIMLHVVDKFIRELQEQLRPKKVKIQLSKEARDYLARKGFDPRFGARPLSRVIQQEIKDRLSDEILFGTLKRGGLVRIDCQDDRLSFSFSSDH